MRERIVLASNNAGKVREFNQLLTGSDIDVIPQNEFSVAEIEETGLTFVENALLKARNAAAHTGLPAVADDSGLEVDALQGAPGIYSARYAGAGASDQVLDEAQDLQDVGCHLHAGVRRRNQRDGQSDAHARRRAVDGRFEQSA